MKNDHRYWVEYKGDDDKYLYHRIPAAAYCPHRRARTSTICRNCLGKGIVAIPLIELGVEQ